MEGRQPDHQHIPNLKGPFRCDPYTNESERYGALKALVKSGDYEGVLKALAAGNLRGMGGALFPTALPHRAQVGNRPQGKEPREIHHL
jgi:NADH:ubiquinone oxidoreductase subunit F (NADH-binding)